MMRHARGSGDCTSRGPVKSYGLGHRVSGRHLNAFLVKADRSHVDEMLRRYIGRPSQELGLQVNVSALISNALFVFLKSSRYQVSDGGKGSEGQHTEQMFAVVVFGYRTRPTPVPSSSRLMFT